MGGGGDKLAEAVVHRVELMECVGCVDVWDME